MSEPEAWAYCVFFICTAAVLIAAMCIFGYRKR